MEVMDVINEIETNNNPFRGEWITWIFLDEVESLEVKEFNK